MTALWLTRARLRQAAPVAALARLLVPEDGGDRQAAAHRLVWALFADAPDRRRDFLWRQDRPGEFLALSARPPNPLHDLFAIESRPFEPVLAVGDRLAFRLHANPVVAEAQPPGADGARRRGKRQDVVMHALHRLPRCTCRPGAVPDTAEDCPQALQCRAERRFAIVQETGSAWLARQGAAHGFRPLGTVAVDGYETVRIPRGRGEPLRFGVLDLEGVLEVTDPARFVATLAAGFGRARAFGCGLMLIRRAGPARGHGGAGPARGHGGAGPARGHDGAGPARGHGGAGPARVQEGMA